MHVRTDQVAPHAGAWIETLFAGSVLEYDQVAPHAGAWIETPRIKAVDSSASVSPLTQGRGLKHRKKK